MVSTLEKIRGGLFGQALGDAFAMPAYFTIEQTRAAYGDWITEFLPGPDDHEVHKGFIAGRFTDDTEQAFALAESILQNGGVTLNGTVQAILGWYDKIDGDHSPYVGPSTRRGVDLLRKGVDPHKTGSRGDTNGSAMRVSVVGLINPGDLDGAIHEAAISAIPTHGTDVGISGACAVACAVAGAFNATSIEELVQAGIYGANEGRKQGNKWLAASLTRRIELAVEIARRPVDIWQRFHEIYDLVGTGLLITESVAAAFGILVMADGDPMQTAIYAAALSGDADTIGAIACAIAGTYRGIGAIPAAAVQKLTQVNPDYDFEQTARGLYDLAIKRHPNLK